MELEIFKHKLYIGGIHFSYRGRFFIKFILSLIIGAGVSIALPLVLATLASNMGYITVANYNEIQAEKTAKILETEKNPDYKNIPAGIKYLIII